MCRSENKILLEKRRTSAFTLIEVMVALAILGAILSSVLVVMNRCIEATIDSRTKMQAFELARENMEKLLAGSTVKDMAEFGTSEENPDIQWETVVEGFFEPITSRMWMQAVCSASYTDSEGETQTVELTHWLTDVSKDQLLQILEQRSREKEYLEGLAQELSLEEQIEILAEKTGISTDEAESLLEDMTLLGAYEAVILAKETGIPINQAADILDDMPMNTAYPIIILSQKVGISIDQAAEVMQADPHSRGPILRGFKPDIPPNEIPEILNSPEMEPPEPPPEIVPPPITMPKPDRSEPTIIDCSGKKWPLSEVNKMDFATMIKLFWC